MSTKISQLTSATDITASDLMQIVDVEDGVMAPSGTNKKITASLLAKELAKQPLEPGIVISGSSSGDAVRITQTGSGNALVVENSTNPDSTPFVIDANGNVGIGTGTPISKLHLTSSDPSWSSGLTLENTAASRKFVLSTRSDLSFPARFSISDETALSERVSILGSNGDLGIGELNPSSRLHVAGDLTMSSATVATSATAGTNGDVPAQVAGYLVVKINGTARKIPYYA